MPPRGKYRSVTLRSGDVVFLEEFRRLVGARSIAEAFSVLRRRVEECAPELLSRSVEKLGPNACAYEA